jgi:uncharacterized DUF497 family protein
MKPFEWNKTKNEWLQKERGISFEEIVIALNEGKVVDTYEHFNQEKYPGQKVFVLEIEKYAYVVPFVEDNDKFFLKTIFRSRKATQKYLKGGKHGQSDK